MTQINKGYRLFVLEYDDNWNERIRELGSGRIYEQGERLFKGWKERCGPKTLKLVLEDRSGAKEDKVHEF